MLSVLAAGIFQANAQNLVPNASFEINIGCPAQIGEVDKADGWINWGVTPDYFHACANTTTPAYGTPTNVRGFQPPRTGLAYMGLFTFNDQLANHREFIGRELAQPLTIGTTYFVSLWVSRAGQLLCTHASSNIGVRFTTVSGFSQANPDTALNNGHVFATTVITDSIGWVHVSGSFVADSAYTHMGIGNYFDDAGTLVDTSNAASNYAYYLVDDVCVSPDPLFCDTETGVNENIQPAFLVIPNPASRILNIVTGMECSGLMEFRSMKGTIVASTPVSLTASQAFSYDVTHLSPGIYFISISGDSGTFFQKLILF